MSNLRNRSGTPSASTSISPELPPPPLNMKCAKYLLMMAFTSFSLCFGIVAYFVFTTEAVTDLQARTLKYPDLCFLQAKKGDFIEVHYIGSFLDGTEFDNSYKRNKPYSFTLGKGKVIVGWEEGIPGMCLGEKRELLVPSDMAYGEQGNPATGIGPNTALKFEIELMDVNNFKRIVHS